MRWLALLALMTLSFQDPPPAEPTGPLQWKIGKNDFARFDPFKLSFDSGGEEIVRGNPERLAGVFGYEIVDKTLYRPKPLDKSELPLILGFSLPPKQLKPGQSHEWTVELEEGYDYGPVTAKCSATRVPAAEISGDPYARLNLEAKLNPSARASTNPKPPRAVMKGKFEASLYFDVELGVPQRLDFQFWLTLAPVDAKGAIETIELKERIDFLEVLPLRHRKFEGDVNAAIDKGIAYVWRNYNAQEGRWGAHYQHATGPTALALLTILKGTMDRKEPRILKALDWMMAQPLQHTYDVAISLMALEAFYSPADAAARSGQAAAAEKDIASKMDPGHARWGSSAAKWLELNLAQAMWSYPSTDANARDFSNSQYGVLGLYSGARCGFSPDLDIVRRVMETYLRVQRKKGPKVELALQEGELTSKTMARFIAEARGWPYYDNMEDPAYGSMTAGGVASLVILDALRRRANDAKYDPREQAKVRNAIRDGWGWMLDRWSVKGNPAHGRDWFYYWLYGLERCAMLDGVARVGEHDWYGEGALHLVANQANDGAWWTGKGVALYDVCFAILFLKRATVRVATGK